MATARASRVGNTWYSADGEAEYSFGGAMGPDGACGRITRGDGSTAFVLGDADAAGEWAEMLANGEADDSDLCWEE